MKWIVGLAAGLICLSAEPLWAVDPLLPELAKPEGYTSAIKILLVLTLLSFVPSLMLAMTSFTRLVVVFSLMRQAMGTQGTPPNQVMAGLALFMTFFIMHPVWSEINEEALTPYFAEEIQEAEAFEKAVVPMRSFMYKQIRKKDLSMFVDLAKIPQPKDLEEIPFNVLVPAFITSELRTAFEIAFLLYIPFLVIDMVVASVLMSMGMMLLPPIMISLPFKLMMFVLADGWNLIIQSLVESF